VKSNKNCEDVGKTKTQMEPETMSMMSQKVQIVEINSNTFAAGDNGRKSGEQENGRPPSILI
jgi:hypothetical protein